MAERSRQRSRLAGAGPALSGTPTLAGIGKDFTRLILKPSSASRDIWTLARSLLPFLLSLQHTITECLPAKHPHHPPSSLVPALNSQPPLAPTWVVSTASWDSSSGTCQQRHLALPGGSCHFRGPFHTRHTALAPPRAHTAASSQLGLAHSRVLVLFRERPLNVKTIPGLSDNEG